MTSTPDPSSRRWWLLPLLAAVLFTVLAVRAAWVDAPTVDEVAHVPAGCVYWRYGRLDLYAKNPPLVKYWLAAPLALDRSVTVPAPPTESLGWAPVEYGVRFQQANFTDYLGLLFRARLMNIALALATAAVLLGWAWQVLGPRPACVASALLLLCPNVLAHSHVATTDVGSMFTIALTLWAATWAYAQPQPWRLALVGAAWGLALLAKFTAVLLLPPLVIIAVVLRWRERSSPRRPWLMALGDFSLMAATALLVVNLGMGFTGSFMPLGEHQFMSNTLQGLQRGLGWLPVPLPRDYVMGFDAQLFDTQGGEFGSYLMGQWSARGWWYYNAVVLAIKTPVLTLALVAAGAVAWWRSRGALGWRGGVCVLVPLLFLMVMMMLFNRLNIGVRYLLPLWPPAFLLIGACWWSWRGRRSDVAALAVALVAAATLGLASSNSLAYFNLPSRLYGPPQAWVLDSNLDWGQDLSRLPDTLAELGHQGPIHLLAFGHADPALYGIEYELVPPWPVNGIVVVSVNYLHGAAYRANAPDGRLVTIKRGHVDWLAGREPVARAGGLVVYRITDAPPPPTRPRS